MNISIISKWHPVHCPIHTRWWYRDQNKKHITKEAINGLYNKSLWPILLAIARVSNIIWLSVTWEQERKWRATAETRAGVTFSEAPGLGANRRGVRQPMSLTSRYIEELVLLIKYKFHTLIHDKIQWKHCNPPILKSWKTDKFAGFWMKSKILLSPYEIQWGWNHSQTSWVTSW